MRKLAEGKHRPVLLEEVLEYLDPKPNENFIDCTFGFGGHGLALLEKNKPAGKVLGIEIEKRILEETKAPNERLILVNDSYGNLKKIVEDNNFKSINGILLDLGMCSWQIEASGQGFSFLKDEPLDMRFGDGGELRAEEIVNDWPQERLVQIFKEYGEERYAFSAAKAIGEERRKGRIRTSRQLSEILESALAGKYRRSRIHPATRVFQALRIAVNDELENLKKVLPQAVEILEAGGRLAVISFHSLEDRIVKQYFRQMKKEGVVKLLTKKPVIPGFEEVRQNPKSRSAKLRVALKQ